MMYTVFQVMEYLKKIVPKMFQNTLSNLTNSIIQQFLDELSFRSVVNIMPSLTYIVTWNFTYNWSDKMSSIL